MLRALALLATLHGGTALRLSPALTQHCKTALVAGFCSAQLLAAPAFGLVGPTLSEVSPTSHASRLPPPCSTPHLPPIPPTVDSRSTHPSISLLSNPPSHVTHLLTLVRAGKWGRRMMNRGGAKRR